MTIELQSFNVPNYAIARMSPRLKQDGIHEGPSFPLADIDADELSMMCDDFRREIFRKAKKPDPKAKE
jgi:hypothetical protein